MKLLKLELYEYEQEFKHPIKTPKINLDYRKSLFIGLYMSNGNWYFGESNAFETNWYANETIEDVKGKAIQWFELNHNKDFYDLKSVQKALNMLEQYPATRSMLVMAFYQMFNQLNTFNVPYGATISGMSEANLKQLIDTKPQRVKLKWSDNILEDVQKIQNLPINLQIAIDANESLTDNEQNKLARLSEENILYIEEPFYSMEKLQNYYASNLPPIALDEKASSEKNIISAIKDFNIKVIIIKPFRLGGIDRALYLIQLIRELGAKVVIGGMYEFGLSRYFTAMLAQYADYPSDITPEGYYFNQDIVANSGILKGGSIEFEPPNVLVSNMKRIY
ncbi:o-succinylbenzoate synthase [Staphylococcus sp. ACRSN]|uniref:o-succinylbenzoate synthase n=1 Tax=Staphylococcus sp. ACRSN TaxID=2918214 RepID=UPI001EF3419A|nr:o-succinylbenzoate synthase [Staphylococcus sp. ACRSN]MCG7338375.1 o-succinylbenzoate synthase [Staphylococcus sp. ACRSN]